MTEGEFHEAAAANTTVPDATRPGSSGGREPWDIDLDVVQGEELGDLVLVVRVRMQDVPHVIRR